RRPCAPRAGGLRGAGVGAPTVTQSSDANGSSRAGEQSHPHRNGTSPEQVPGSPSAVVASGSPMAERIAARIAVVGCGHVGAVTAAGLAQLGHAVAGVDIDAGLVALLGGGSAPFMEPGL